MISVKEAFSDDWKALLVPNCPIAFGVDPATTENQTSNPTGFACVQKVGLDYIVRLACRWKTNDPDIARALIKQAVTNLPHGLKPRRLVVDASNERYFASDLRKFLRGVCMTELVSSTEKHRYQGEEMPMKVYLGNLLVNTMDDGHLLLPESKWLSNDFRLVKRDRGSFTTELDNAGGHGDVFDAVKNALHGLISRSGPVQISATNTGQHISSGHAHNNYPMRPEDVRDDETTERFAL